MRVVHATALAAAALLLASVASAQGIGDTAAREKEKRKAAPAKPAKVYTESDLGGGGSVAAAPAPQDTATPAGGAGGTPPAAGADGKASKESTGGAAEDPKAAAQAAWRQQLEKARKEEAVYKDIVEKTQLQLNDVSGMYTPSYAAAMTYLEENKKKLADVQAQIASLEEEGRRNLYR
ncbi:MAG TPA: hypothetical protein VMT70_24125 [Vicinamibacteria bacterium]|nr:hypothetical protein [Vicinamibacteria bacterium]